MCIGLPIVLFDKVTADINTHKVTIQNFKGAFQATEHLIKQGFRKIAHITGPSFLSTTTERLNGYKTALKKHNIPFREELVKYCNHGEMLIREVESAMQSLFELSVKPDSVLAGSDSTTVAVFQILKNLKKEGKIGLAGFSDNKLCSLLSPAITVVQQPAFEIGKIAVELLIDLIESQEPVKKFEEKYWKLTLLSELQPKGISGRKLVPDLFAYI